ncbi:hypothetical protein [Vibrio breoganii]|uniref:hypothetical protein n=1 Tax=Vibrio breoganii TaxID=553239 RepID=UPI0013000B20|nr:hypothetical protein [Vibrio breoganii]
MVNFEYLVQAKASSLGVSVEVIMKVIATKIVNGDMQVDDEPFPILMSIGEDDL